jgi:hypothetical protein
MDILGAIVGNIKNDIWIGSLYYVIFLFMLLNRNYVCMYVYGYSIYYENYIL